MPQTPVTRSELDGCRTEVVLQLAEIEDKFIDMDRKFTSIETDIRRTLEIVEAWDNAKGFINVVRGLSTTVKILTPIALVIGGFLYFLTHGTWPSK